MWLPPRLAQLLKRLRRVLSVHHDPGQTTQALHPHLSSGFNRSLLLLLLHGSISVGWGTTMVVFATGVIPIAWRVSQYGQRHMALTNVFVAAVGTLATAHLKYTVCLATDEYARMRLAAGLPLTTWEWLQGLASMGIFPPFQRDERKWTWGAWLLLFGAMAGGHSASVVAILQPQSFLGYVPSNDPAICGVDPASLTMNSNLTAQHLMDQDAFMFGLQLGAYSDQLAGNTTTAVAGRIYLKDNFGYGVTTSLPNALQQVAGTEITAQCYSSHDATSLPSLCGALLASIAHDASHAIIKISSNSTYVPFNTTSMSFSWKSMYAVVNASGSGALFIADSSGLSTGCKWAAIPRLVHIEVRDFIAFAATANDTSMVPAPVGRAVYATVRGIAQAIRFGATLDATTAGYPSAADVLQCLLADGLKAALTAQYTEACWADTAQCRAVGIVICDSETQAVQEHWRFGNEHSLGVLAIMLTLGFGVYAVGVVLTLLRRPRVHGVDPFKVVDGFKIGLDAAKGGDEATRFWAVDHGILVARGEDWTIVEEPESEETVPLVPMITNS
ncbi:hypothetical protein B0H13DRAFT_2106431 [Mycena leptocephala]|nr:hypothetical protein B0H13DRAFT_2106431 [Mycena leptocephala]